MKISIFFNPAYGISRSIIAFLLGLAFVIWPGVAVNLLVRVLGAMLILIGGVSLALNFTGKERLGSLMVVNGCVALIFGIILMVFPDFFVNLVSYLFGIVLIIVGVGEIVTLISAGRRAPVAFSYYIIPVLLFICGIIMMANPYETVETLFIVFGIAMTLYAIFEFIASLKFRKLFQLAEKSIAAVEAEPVDVEAEVVESKVEQQEDKE